MRAQSEWIEQFKLDGNLSVGNLCYAATKSER